MVPWVSDTSADALVFAACIARLSVPILPPATYMSSDETDETLPHGIEAKRTPLSRRGVSKTTGNAKHPKQLRNNGAVFE